MSVGILARYITACYLRMFALCLVAATGLFLLFDFFSRIADFAGYDSGSLTIASYFLLKTPRIATEVYPAAALLAVMLSMGRLAVNDEILAVRACGVSPWQLAMPLAMASVAISAIVLVANETIVPPTAAASHAVKQLDIKDRRDTGMLDASSIWFQTDTGFVNIDYFDAARNVVRGVTLHELDEAFHLKRVLRIPEAVWENGVWRTSGGTVTDFDEPEGRLPRALRSGEATIESTPTELRKKRRRSYEFSYRQLAAQIERLESKGLDTSEYRVDLHFKLAAPFSGVVAVMLGFPLAIRGRRRSGVTFYLGLGLLVCFVYWTATALTVSAGHAGMLPPPVAAWAPNLLFTLGSGWLYSSSEA